MDGGVQGRGDLCRKEDREKECFGTHERIKKYDLPVLGNDKPGCNNLQISNTMKVCFLFKSLF